MSGTCGSAGWHGSNLNMTASNVKLSSSLYLAINLDGPLIQERAVNIIACMQREVIKLTVVSNTL